MKSKNQPEEKRCIETFVSGYSELKDTSFKIEKWPDQNNPGDIDALASDGNEDLAIEHTSIDSFEKQREDDAVFKKVFSSISKELNGCFDGRVTVIVPIKAVRFKNDQNTIRKDLKEFLEGVIPDLPYGVVSEVKSSNLDFDIKVRKDKSDKKLIGFARPAPESLRLEERLREAIEAKTKKFKRNNYHKETKILLIENNDIALVSPVDFRLAWDTISGQGIKNYSDQIWYVDSSIESEFYFHPLFSLERLSLEEGYMRVKPSPN